MSRYNTVLVGCGPRGEMHARAILANPERFTLRAVCDLEAARLVPFAAQFNIAKTYTDAETMLASEQPDVLCFATLPAVRLPLVELGVKYGVKALAFEKPMALSLTEARQITQLCATAGVKAIVCHQLKYGTHWQKAWEIAQGGAIGEIRLLHATARPSMLRVGTHLVDAMLWLNGNQRGLWVMGQGHGTAAYAEDHPCPDHITGVIQFANGARGVLECGTLAPHLMPEEDFWLDGAVTVYGTHGYVQAGIGNGWHSLSTASGGQLLSGPSDLTPQEPRFYRDLADWLDDPQRLHPCNIDTSYHGFELLIGMGLSSLDRRHVAVPITPLPTTPVLASLEKVLAQPYHTAAL
jgi:predicted dehydrogenase